MFRQSADKPPKPYAEFPLYAHASRRWAKKIKGKTHFFGSWDKPHEALDKYHAEVHDLQAGRKPRRASTGVTVAEAVNAFLTTKENLVESGELSPKTFVGYHRTCLAVADAFGKSRIVVDLRADDFDELRVQFSKGRGPVALGNEIRNTRVLFKYAYDAGLVDTPLRFGPTFKVPAKRVLRAARHAAGPRMFEAGEINAMLGRAEGQLRAMILLGINCGFGNTDCATLPKSAIDLDAGWVDFPRPKTAVPRRCPLWPETQEAIGAVIARRRKAREEADFGLAFITKYGHRWVRMHEVPQTEENKHRPKWITIDSLAQQFAKLLIDIGIKRDGLNFYALRHTFRTIADESRDQPAVNSIMGHDPGDMASFYRERIADNRLLAVINYVHGRLWPAEFNQNAQC